MRTEVRDIIGEDDPGDFWTNTELNRYIQEAEWRFLGEENWPWLITQGSDILNGGGDGQLEVVEGISVSRHINVTLQVTTETRSYQPKRVTPVVGFELLSRYPEGTKRSFPDYYYVTSVADTDDDGHYETVLQFVPIPTNDMDVRWQYYRRGNAFTADNDVSDSPLEFHKALVHYAAGTAWLKELNGETKAQEQFQLYAGVVDQARGETLTEPDDTPLVAGKMEPQVDTYQRDVYGERDFWLSRMPETLGP